jgi:hypothetical protein
MTQMLRAIQRSLFLPQHSPSTAKPYSLASLAAAAAAKQPHRSVTITCAPAAATAAADMHTQEQSQRQGHSLASLAAAAAARRPRRSVTTCCARIAATAAADMDMRIQSQRQAHHLGSLAVAAVAKQPHRSVTITCAPAAATAAAGTPMQVVQIGRSRCSISRSLSSSTHPSRSCCSTSRVTLVCSTALGSAPCCAAAPAVHKHHLAPSAAPITTTESMCMRIIRTQSILRTASSSGSCS